METKTNEIFLEVEKALSTVNATREISSNKILGMRVSPERTNDALRILSDNLRVKHLSTITGLDDGETVEIDYQFSHGDKIIVVKTSVPKTDPKIQTCTAVIPGAILYEMEVHDMFGVSFEGNPWMDRKLLLPDNYPADLPPPLLKSTSTERIRKAVGLEK
jgi:NADH:ubiquinone oxidoreductase subunit C